MLSNTADGGRDLVLGFEESCIDAIPCANEPFTVQEIDRIFFIFEGVARKATRKKDSARPSNYVLCK